MTVSAQAANLLLPLLLIAAFTNAANSTTTDYSWATTGSGSAKELFLYDLKKAQAGEGSQLVVYGDSILDCLSFNATRCTGVKDVYDRRFAHLNPLVFAVGGDSPASVMGKMLDGIVPTKLGKKSKVPVLINIGHNGLGTLGGGVELTWSRVEAIINYLLAVDPDNEVVALSMLPSTGGDGLWVGSGTYAPSKYLDAQLQYMAGNNSRVHFANCEPLFMDKEAPTYADRVLLPDGVHPSAKGFEVIADCLSPYIEGIAGVGTKPSPTSTATVSTTNTTNTTTPANTTATATVATTTTTTVNTTAAVTVATTNTIYGTANTTIPVTTTATTTVSDTTVPATPIVTAGPDGTVVLVTTYSDKSVAADGSKMSSASAVRLPTTTTAQQPQPQQQQQQQQQQQPQNNDDPAVITGVGLAGK